MKHVAWFIVTIFAFGCGYGAGEEEGRRAGYSSGHDDGRVAGIEAVIDECQSRARTDAEYEWCDSLKP